MNTQHLFVYGTLLDEATRERVIGRKVAGQPDVLNGFTEKSIEVNGEDYACAEAAEDKAIQGMTLELSDEELQKVDAYETGSYSRQKTALASGTTAWFYALS